VTIRASKVDIPLPAEEKRSRELEVDVLVAHRTGKRGSRRPAHLGSGEAQISSFLREDEGYLSRIVPEPPG
jgi:hypothetical protein